MGSQLLLIAGLIAAGLIGALISWQANRRHIATLRERSSELMTELQACEEALTKANIVGALSEVSFNALLLLDEKQHILHMNQAARQLFKQRDTDLSERGSTLISVTRHHELDELAQEALASSEGVEYQISIDKRPYRVRIQFVETGGTRLLTIALQDVSEIQRLDRARRDMVANVSHELRTPITSIRLLTDTLKRDKLYNKGRGHELLQKIADETDTLQQIAQELLDLTMIESGRAEFIMKPVRARDIIEQTVEHFTEQLKRGKLTATIHAAPELIVLADAQQVERVLTNLLHNAIKFTPEGGSIDLEVQSNGNWLTFCVTDTGPGISPDERSRVFERFYRGDRARRGVGTGLGLAIAKHIVQSHGGVIWAEEPPRPPGGRICFTLPTPDE